MPERAVIIGNGVNAARVALELANQGDAVTLVAETPTVHANQTDWFGWPLILKAAAHPRIKLLTDCEVECISGSDGRWTVKALRLPRYVSKEHCTACGKCEKECPVQVQTEVNGSKVLHHAIHPALTGPKSVPSAYSIQKRGMAACRIECPLHINVQGYVALIGKGRPDKARTLIDEAAPLSGVLGRLCTHPCETGCARIETDSPVSIQALHRHAAGSRGPITYTRKAPSGSCQEKIAIIGAGPCGLTAAWELARRGYRPTVFDALARPGGLLASAIPQFRLPRHVVEREIAAIEALGVSFVTGVKFGVDITYAGLCRQGYQAFLLATGAWCSNRLNIPGEDLPGVVDGLSYLSRLNTEKAALTHEDMAVIGGGNSAIDAARSARRMTIGKVKLLCLTENVTGIVEEAEEAYLEGVEVEYNTSPLEILGENGTVAAVRCQRVRNVVFGPGGSFTADYIPGSEFTVAAQSVVVAIGQRPDPCALNIPGLVVNRNSTLAADPLTLATNIPGVFAGGDAVTGSRNVVEAMAAGLQAAESIDRYLNGAELAEGRGQEKPVAAEPVPGLTVSSSAQRARMRTLPLSRRKALETETDLGLTSAAALREAGRCLNCAVCSECRECETICELKAVHHADTAERIVVQAERVVDLRAEKDEGQTGYDIEIVRRSIPGLPAEPDVVPSNQSPAEKVPVRCAVVLCRCGGLISSVVDFESVGRSLLSIEGVCIVDVVDQACAEEDSHRIRDMVAGAGVSHVVLAACRCCGLAQVCYNCTDRRVRCQDNLALDIPSDISMQFVNLREHCAKVHSNEPAAATAKAHTLVEAGVMRAKSGDISSYVPVVVNAPLCRGCGDCVKICPHITLDTSGNSPGLAVVNAECCNGCGACIGGCPTGALSQPAQTEAGLEAALVAVLGSSCGKGGSA